MENNYKNGLLDGISKMWNEKGILIFEGKYLRGKREGIFKTFYDNGKLETKVTYGEKESIVEMKRWDKIGKLETN